MHPFFPWYGGKARLAKRIVSYFPPHQIYVEPFGGAASCLLAKIPAPIEIYNDKLSEVVNFFRVISKQETFDLFYRQVVTLPYSRQIFQEARLPSSDPITNAVNFYILARQTYSGYGKSNTGWVYSLTSLTRNMNLDIHQYYSSVDKLPQIISRLHRVQFENLDFREVFARYDTEETLFYVDPPYPLSTRGCSQYTHEMSDSDHSDLIKILLSIKGKAIVSTYWTPKYSILGPHLTFRSICSAIHHSQSHNKERTECLFFVQKPQFVNPSIYLQSEMLY